MKNNILSKKTVKINRKKHKKGTLSNFSKKDFTFKTLINKNSKKKNKTIKQYCDIYKKDITDKLKLPLYNSCKKNQYCRKYKCKNIDNKFRKKQIEKLGNNYNTLLMSSLYSKCPSTISDKKKKLCYNMATKKFYKENNLDEVYKKVLECDKKTCSKEKKIFYTNLFRINKNKKHVKLYKPLIIEDLVDKEMIEN